MSDDARFEGFVEVAKKRMALAKKHQQEVDLDRPEEDSKYWETFYFGLSSSVSDNHKLEFGDRFQQSIDYGIDFESLEKIVGILLKMKLEDERPTKKVEQERTLDRRITEASESMQFKLRRTESDSPLITTVTGFLKEVYADFIGIKELVESKEELDEAVEKIKGISDRIEAKGIPKKIVEHIYNESIFIVKNEKLKEKGTGTDPQYLSRVDALKIVKEKLSEKYDPQDVEDFFGEIKAGASEVSESHGRFTTAAKSKKILAEKKSFTTELFNKLREDVNGCVRGTSHKASSFISVEEISLRGNRSIRSGQGIERILNAVLNFDIFSPDYDRIPAKSGKDSHPYDSERLRIKKSGPLRVIYAPAHGRAVYAESLKEFLESRDLKYLPWIVPLVADEGKVTEGIVRAFFQDKKEVVAHKFNKVFEADVKTQFFDLLRAKKSDGGVRLGPEALFLEAYAAFIDYALTGITPDEIPQWEEFKEYCIKRVNPNKVFVPHEYRAKIAAFMRTSKEKKLKQITEAREDTSELEKYLAALYIEAKNPGKAMHYLLRHESLLKKNKNFQIAQNAYTQNPNDPEVIRILEHLRKGPELEYIQIKKPKDFLEMGKEFIKDKVLDVFESFYADEIKSKENELDEEHRKSDAFFKGLLHYYHKDFGNALHYFQRDLKINNNPYALYNLGFCYKQMGKKDEALEVFDKARTRFYQEEEVPKLLTELIGRAMSELLNS